MNVMQEKIKLLKRLNMVNWLKKVNATQTNLTSNLVKKADYDTEIKEIEDKIPDHDKHVK